MKKTELTAAVNARLAETKRALSQLDDNAALEVLILFSLWKIGAVYEADDKVRYKDKLYRVVQAHISQEDWSPENTPALYTEIVKPGEIPVWRKPTGVQDAYNYGDKVYYPTKDDDIYQSIYDGKNSWSPDEYPQGWEKIS